MIIQRIKSKLPLTEYAPKWNYPLGLETYQNTENIDIIKNWLIENENEFKKLPYTNDGGTGLGEDSVTTRYGQYNLFDYSDQLPQLDDFLRFLRLAYLDFIYQDGTDICSNDIVCWFNILRNGEEISEHAHGNSYDVYLSGNFHLDDYNTKTFYRCPQSPNLYFNVDNVKGGLTLFPSCLPHGIEIYEGTSPRVSIAFDLRVTSENRLDYKARPFMNEEIYKTLLNQAQNDNLHTS